MVFGLKKKWGAKAGKTVAMRLTWMEDSLDILDQDLAILDRKIEKARNPESSVVQQQFLKITNRILQMEEELENLKGEILPTATRQKKKYNELKRKARSYIKLKTLTKYIKSVQKQ